jgi:hypothetical protein
VPVTKNEVEFICTGNQWRMFFIMKEYPEARVDLHFRTLITFFAKYPTFHVYCYNLN